MPDDVVSAGEESTDIIPDSSVEGARDIVLRVNGRGSAITAGSPACLLVSGGTIDGKTATIPAADNLRFFEGVWLPNADGTTSIADGQVGRVKTRGLIVDPSTGTGLARVFGDVGITGPGIFLMYTAGNDYFQIFADLYSDLDEQVCKIVSGEAWPTASVGSKKVFLK
jgi:hypothetical protein